MSAIPAYRVTSDDLPDLDHKTADALEPLLSALNDKMQRMVSALNALAVPTLITARFTTADNGAAYLDFNLPSQASDVWVTALVPTDGSTLDGVWGMSWIGRGTGIRALLVGLQPLTTYSLRMLWQ